MERTAFNVFRGIDACVIYYIVSIYRLMSYNTLNESEDPRVDSSKTACLGLAADELHGEAGFNNDRCRFSSVEAMSLYPRC
jgi:hypothetical protein